MDVPGKWISPNSAGGLGAGRDGNRRDHVEGEGWRERMWGKTACIGGHLKRLIWKPSAVGTSRVTLVRTPSNGGY